MARISNKNSAEYVAKRQEFQANNLSAEFEYINKTNAYVVRSYGYYPVFVYVDGQWYENENRYSKSTAKQMTLCGWDIKNETIKVSKDKLNSLIRGESFRLTKEKKDPVLNSMKAFLMLGDLMGKKGDTADAVKYKEKIVFATMRNKIPNWQKPNDWDCLNDAEKLERLNKIQTI